MLKDYQVMIFFLKKIIIDRVMIFKSENGTSVTSYGDEKKGYYNFSYSQLVA